MMEYNIGFNPETLQYNWGNPQRSSFGDAIRGNFQNYTGVDYHCFPFAPYFGVTDYMGDQVAGIRPSEYLFVDTFGYRGILPYELQSPSNEPYPYELDYPFNRMA